MGEEIQVGDLFGFANDGPATLPNGFSNDTQLGMVHTLFPSIDPVISGFNGLCSALVFQALFCFLQLSQ